MVALWDWLAHVKPDTAALQASFREAGRRQYARPTDRLGAPLADHMTTIGEGRSRERPWRSSRRPATAIGNFGARPKMGQVGHLHLHHPPLCPDGPSVTSGEPCCDHWQDDAAENLVIGSTECRSAIAPLASATVHYGPRGTRQIVEDRNMTDGNPATQRRIGQSGACAVLQPLGPGDQFLPQSPLPTSSQMHPCPVCGIHA
jgi:hypothetical protein